MTALTSIGICPSARTLGGVLDEIAAARPGHPAIMHFGETLSYRELQQRSLEAAQALLAMGVKRGDRVGVLFGNQPEWMVMYQAILLK